MKRVSRWSMLSVGLFLAVTLIASVAGAQAPDQPGGRFVDDNGSTHEPAIEAIAAAGITVGCGSDRFCPEDSVTRGQMAAFLRRALDLPPALGPSGFVDTAGTFSEDIERLRAAGITVGCGSDRFCPEDSVTRGQMATFLQRALGLKPITPPPPTEPPPGECTVLPANNVWNARVDSLPAAARSDQYVATIGANATVHPDFGSGEWPEGSGAPIGIPFVELDGAEAMVPVEYTEYGSESDPGPMPIPLNAPIEGGDASDGDRHVIAVDYQTCRLYELYHAQRGAGLWQAGSGAVFDLSSNGLRPSGWTSADAAGLPIFPGLVRYDEVVAGEITHALRFTAPVTARSHVWPARHDAGSTDSLSAPPMGQRFRLRADFDLSGYSANVRVVLVAMRDYGMILADNGSSWYVSGAPDPRWDNDELRELKSVPGSAFEAVDVSSLMVIEDTGEVTPG